MALVVLTCANYMTRIELSDGKCLSSLIDMAYRPYGYFCFDLLVWKTICKKEIWSGWRRIWTRRCDDGDGGGVVVSICHREWMTSSGGAIDDDLSDCK